MSTIILIRLLTVLGLLFLNTNTLATVQKQDDETWTTDFRVANDELEETTPLEPGNKEYKYYAPGIGLVQDGALKLVRHGRIQGMMR